MKKLIGIMEVKDGFGNKLKLNVFTDREEGVVSYRLVSASGMLHSIGNLQCGWKGRNLPDNTYEFETNEELFKAASDAVNGGVYNVVESKLFVKGGNQ